MWYPDHDVDVTTYISKLSIETQTLASMQLYLMNIFWAQMVGYNSHLDSEESKLLLPNKDFTEESTTVKRSKALQKYYYRGLKNDYKEYRISH